MAGQTLAYDIAFEPTEAQRFYATLFHDNRASNAILATKHGGIWSERCIPCAQLPHLASTFIDQNDRYVTVNGFIGAKRDVASCRQVNALVIDIDCHSADSTNTVQALLARFSELNSKNSIPSPTVAVATGRGLQLFYVLEHSIPCRLSSGSLNEKALSFLIDVRGMLFDTLDVHLASPVSGASLDRSVSDLSRVVRIPGSFNSAAKCRARLIFDDGPTWSLTNLKTALQPILPNKNPKPSSKRPAKLDRLNTSRMRKTRELVALRDSQGRLKGTRDLCLFVYYNAAKQVLGAVEAKQRTHALNQSTSCPLPVADVNQIAKTVDNAVVQYGPLRGQTGFYPMTAETIIDKLCLTTEEIQTLNFFASKRSDDRAAAKRVTKERRAKRDATICKLYGNGLSQTQVAKRTECSIRTVAKVISREKIIKGNLKAARTANFKVALSRKSTQIAVSTCNYALFWHTSRSVRDSIAESSSTSRDSLSSPLFGKGRHISNDAFCCTIASSSCSSLLVGRFNNGYCRYSSNG